MIIGSLPLAAGVSGNFHTDAALLELIPLSWEIRVGAMRGNTPGSGRIELAWRSRIVTRGVVTGQPDADGGGATAGVGPTTVVVTLEDANTRNLEFKDLVTQRIMTREQFVAAIRAGDYPGYEVRMLKGVATPVSKRSATDDDNLG